MWISRARLLIAALWVGSLWTVGYLVAPTLFATLADHALAGTIAGSLFRAEAWLSIVCGGVLVMLGPADSANTISSRKRWFGLIAAMLACTLIGYFGLQPMMAALREAAGPGGIMTSDARMQFSIVHGISSGLYLIQSLLGAALILRSP